MSRHEALEVEDIQAINAYNEAAAVSEMLLRDLDYALGQGVLFDDERLKSKLRRDLAQENPDKFVLPSVVVDHYRYQAAVLGAGYDLDDDVGTHNKMWDEVSQNVRVEEVLGEKVFDLSTSSFVISRRQLGLVLVSDYLNLRGWMERGTDLLYKRED